MKNLALLAVFLLSVACANSHFFGDNSKNSSDSTNPGEDDEIGDKADCDPAKGVTHVKLLTDKVLIEKADQHIQYKMTLTDCEGKPVDVNGKEVLFDIDASVKNMLDLAYQVYPVKKEDEKSSGHLRNVSGSDLFGNKDEGVKHYAHWRVEALKFTFETNQFILDLDVSNRFFQNRVDPADEKIPTFLSIGEAKPVEEKVTFVKN